MAAAAAVVVVVVVVVMTIAVVTWVKVARKTAKWGRRVVRMRKNVRRK